MTLSPVVNFRWPFAVQESRVLILGSDISTTPSPSNRLRHRIGEKSTVNAYAGGPKSVATSQQIRNAAGFGIGSPLPDRMISRLHPLIAKNPVGLLWRSNASPAPKVFQCFDED